MKRLVLLMVLALAGAGCSRALSAQAERDLAYLVEMDKQTEQALALLNAHIDEACAQRAESLRNRTF